MKLGRSARRRTGVGPNQTVVVGPTQTVAPSLLRARHSLGQPARVTTFVATVEVGCRGPASDQLDIDVHSVPHDVPEEPAVAVNTVEPGVGFEHDPATERDKP